MADSGSRRRVSVLGATGSIGQNTIALLLQQGGADAYDVVALTGAGNVRLLAGQAVKLRARLAVTARDDCYAELRELLAGSGVEAASGAKALAAAAAETVDWTMSAIVGAAGLEPTLAAARHGGVLALANKESMVAAGRLLQAECAQYGTKILPTDSEHSGIFQALMGQESAALDRIILTASGGPFRTWSRAQMAGVTPDMAKMHPRWAMGDRISIDSASMFNKALEIIETVNLFGIQSSQVEVLIHPQSVVHALIEFKDSAVLAHLGPTDMRGAIGFALNWPDRRALTLERLDLAKIGRLDFEAADHERFPALRLAFAVARQGGLSGAVFNAAKETALDQFIAGETGFLDMADRVEKTLEQMSGHSKYGHSSYVFADVAEIDAETRRVAKGLKLH